MQVKIGSLVKLYTILLLREGPKYGYELMKALEEKRGRKIGPSQIYPFLNLLEESELIKIKKVGGREKKVYKLTRKGEEFINRHLQRFGELIELAIKPKLTKCTHCGCTVYEGGYKEKIGKKTLMFCCKHCARSFKESSV